MILEAVKDSGRNGTVTDFSCNCIITNHQLQTGILINYSIALNKTIHPRTLLLWVLFFSVFVFSNNLSLFQIFCNKNTFPITERQKNISNHHYLTTTTTTTISIDTATRIRNSREERKKNILHCREILRVTLLLSLVSSLTSHVVTRHACVSICSFSNKPREERINKRHK